MTEKLLNSSIKQPPCWVSPNTILYGDAIPTENTLLADIDNPKVYPGLCSDHSEKPEMDTQKNMEPTGGDLT